MHSAVLIHLVATVVGVQLAALYVDGAVPYWPIEVSRMAASGPVASSVFLAGALTLGATLHLCGQMTRMNVAMWIALVVIARFDDINHLKLHMAGVAALGAIGIASMIRNSAAILPLTVAIALWGFRIVVKVMAVMVFERRTSIVEAGKHAQTIMMQGPKGTCMLPEHTMPAFYVGGVLQWVVFYVLSMCL